jgi:PAS domain S-box-containing protein
MANPIDGVLRSICEPTLISAPSISSEDCAPLVADEARVLFESACRGEPGPDESWEFAIVDKNAEILYATSAAMRLFGAKGRADLQRALVASESPNARRLRHLAAALPIGGPPRLERMRFTLGRRSMAVNLLCARVSGPSGRTALTLSIPKPENGALFVGPDAQPGSSDPSAGDRIHAEPPGKSRFLWTLDSEGRFGATDPALMAALGAAAPEPGETLERLRLRAEIEHADELAGVIERRETFSDLALLWRRSGEDRKLRVTLSAAPAFDGRREFAGYRGFGVLHEAVGANRGADNTDDHSDLVQSDREPPSGESASSDAPPATEPARPEEETPSSRLQESATKEGQESPIDSAHVEAHAATSLPPDEGTDLSQSVTALLESTDAENAQLDAPHERTAAIYLLRRAAAPSKVIPIRPGAVDALALRDSGQGGGDGVELSRNERDAFREIARALVGRPEALRQDGEIEPLAPVAEADDKPDEAFRSAPSPAPFLEGEGQGFSETAGRNALGLLDRLPVGVLVARDARPLYLNRTLLDLLGFRDLEHFGSSDGLAMMFRGHDPQSVSVEDHSALSIVKSDGRALAVEGHAQAVLWDGAPATLFSLRPATEAGLEKKLRQPKREKPVQSGSAADLQEMLDQATDGAVILDAAGRILSFNRSAERLFGYEQREVAGESVLMLLAPQSHPEATARLDRLSRADEAPEPERPLAVVGRGRDGAALTLALTLARIGSPEAFSYCALIRDLSREREAEGRLIAARDAALSASAAKTDFLAQVSHEIRTPLSAILGFAEVMMEERFGPIGNDRYRDYLKDIHVSGKHVMSLADDLLDLSKIESGKLELAFAPVDANSVIRECVSLMQPQAARERVILRVSLYERLPRVMVDERSLKQVMLNLMSNAVKFNEPGGQVIISTAVDAGGQAVIRVRDTGVGMSEVEVGLALEPFGQIGRPGRKGGVGLGLPLTKALVEANKAEFSIKSRREHGTLIEIAFPVVQAAQ